jgi:hypothetical protein
MTFVRSTALAAGLVLTLAAATPASSPPVEDPEANVVSEVVVNARTPGPAWWKVADADTTVWILALPDAPLPPGVTWNRAVLERRLKGANVLLDSSKLTAGIGDLPGLIKLRAQLRSKTPLEQTLPPALRDRFVADREKLGRSAGRYAGWTPLIAGELLVGDSREERGWTRPARDIPGLARRARVPVRGSARYGAMPFMRTAVAGLTPAIHEQCLEGALDDVEAASRARPAAEGWANGDVRAALTAPRRFDRCVLLLAGGADLWRRVSKDQAEDIAAALQQPGHAVALVGLRRLLARDGVLDQLRARGLTVTGPADRATTD